MLKKIFTIALAAAAATPLFADVIWEGNVTTGSWGNQEGVTCVKIGNANFATAAEGDEIVVTVSDVAAGTEYPKYILKNANGWADLPGSSTIDTPSAGTYTSELEAEAVEMVKANGMIIQGDGLTITKVELNSSNTYSYTTLWEGNGTLAWDYTDVMPKIENNSALAAIKDGDILTFTIAAIGPKGQWPKVCVRDLADKDLATLELWDFVDGPFPMEKSIVVENAAEWKNGIYCVGPAGTTITKIVLGTMDAPQEEDGFVIWQGAPTKVSWSSKLGEVSAAKAAKLVAGDYIIVTVTAIDDAASSEWPKVACKAGSNWDDVFYIELHESRDAELPARFEHQLTAADIDAMKDGFWFGGEGATLTKIEASKAGIGAGVGSIAAESGEKAIYTIQGIRVNNAAIETLPAGLYIINGKKVLVK